MVKLYYNYKVMFKNFYRLVLYVAFKYISLVSLIILKKKVCIYINLLFTYYLILNRKIKFK